jgi:hypothetical protein
MIGRKGERMAYCELPHRIATFLLLAVVARTFLAGQESPRQPQVGTTISGVGQVRYTRDFVWSESPSEDLSAPGKKNVTLSRCPAGVKADEPEYWIYIAGTGTPEAVKVAGGTCKADERSGTLQFVTVHSHPPGYTIGSASDGLQEASIAVAFQPSNPNLPAQAGHVIVSPGTELRLRARVSIRASSQVVDFSGSIFDCYLDDVCVYVGDPKNSVQFDNVTIVNPRGRAMIVNGTRPMIETNAQSTRIVNVTTATGAKGATFGTYVQVDDDQSFLLDGLDSSSRSVRCDSDFCGAYVTAPGPFNVWSAVGWLKNLNISPQCHGNGVDWQSGNTLRVSDSVIQGFQQFGVRTGVRRGGYGGTELDNVYMEEGRGCGIGETGAAGVIAQGGTLTIRSDRSPAGQSPQFQNLGSIYYHYFVVLSHPKFGDSMPLAAGWAKTDGSKPVNVTWPVVRGIKGAGRYKLLRMAWQENIDKPSPVGTGEWLIGTVDPAACGAARCSFEDTHAKGQSYTTVNTFGGVPVYFPVLDFWPGAIVLSSGSDGQTLGSPAKLFIDNAPTGGIVSVARYADGPTIYAQGCQGGSGIGYGPTIYPAMSCLEPGYSTWFLKRGLLFQSKDPNDAGKFVNYKGKINFVTTGTGPSPLITWEDSNPGKTISDPLGRPPAEVTDSDTGIYSRGIQYSRAKTEIRNYIGKLPDASPQESLTATVKTFTVPIHTPKIEGIKDKSVVANLNADMVDGIRLTKFAGGKCLESSPDGSGIVESPGHCGAGGGDPPRAEQFTYTFFDAHNVLTAAQLVPSVYVNLTAPLHITGVYCEIDSGEASINLQKEAGATKSPVLSKDLPCSQQGAISTATISGSDTVAVGEKLDHVTVKAAGNLHRMNVVVKYTVD